MPGLERAPAASALVRVTESSQVGEARRTAAALCHRLGFEDTEGGRVSIVATELATNLVKHGGGGEVLIRSLREGDVSGIEMMALDRGPGIRDLDAALTDGHSTAGTPGGGLGAIRRLSSAFDVYTSHGHGTAVLSRLWQRAAPGSSVVHGAVCVAKSGEDECGDAWDVEVRAAGCRVVVADGLGHGRLAREAAVTALGATYDRPGPSRALEDAHLASRSTRGAAITIADVDIAAQEVRLAGLGNVVAALVGDERVQNMVSMNGTAGQGALKVREFTYRFTLGALLVMASDGLATHWSLDRYPGLSERHPALIAGVLYRDHSRQRDDVTIVAARLGTRA